MRDEEWNGSTVSIAWGGGASLSGDAAGDTGRGAPRTRVERQHLSSRGETVESPEERR